MSEKSLEEELVDVPAGELARVTTFGMQEVSRLAAVEARLVEHKIFLTPSSPSFGYFVNMRASETAATLGEKGLMVTKATQKLREV